MDEEENSGRIDLDALMKEAAELAWRERRDALVYAPPPPRPRFAQRLAGPLAGFVAGIACAAAVSATYARAPASTMLVAAQPPASMRSEPQPPPAVVLASPPTIVVSATPPPRAAPPNVAPRTQARVAAKAVVPPIASSAPPPSEPPPPSAPPPSEPPPEDFVAAARRIDGVAASTAGASATPIPAPPPTGLDAHPTYGQVVVGLSSAMPGARACVHGAEPVSARITFANDGTATGVDVPGADDATRACIARALASATVPPFAEPKYVVPVVVRPPRGAL